MLETILLLEIEKEAKADYMRRALQVFQRLLAIYYLRRSRFCNVQVALKGPPTLWDALGSVPSTACFCQRAFQCLVLIETVQKRLAGL